MKSLFLYRNLCNDNLNIDGLYNFSNKLIGIDINAIDKKNRLNFVNKYKLREFHVLQNYFNNFIRNAQNSSIDILSIKFTEQLDDEDTIDIKKYIDEREYSSLIKEILIIADNIDCDIDKISFSYNRNKFEISKSGILEIYADEDEINLNEITNLLCFEAV